MLALTDSAVLQVFFFFAIAENCYANHCKVNVNVKLLIQHFLAESQLSRI